MCVVASPAAGLPPTQPCAQLPVGSKHLLVALTRHCTKSPSSVPGHLLKKGNDGQLTEPWPLGECSSSGHVPWEPQVFSACPTSWWGIVSFPTPAVGRRRVRLLYRPSPDHEDFLPRGCSVLKELVTLPEAPPPALHSIFLAPSKGTIYFFHTERY